ncbi:MAG TPA: hypothetical protein VHW72_07275 [Candidatus Angelobacter sp.]|jgi:hypothetical protein|nr:hypothetical protein [Candidatus Angelobacter sp.]
MVVPDLDEHGKADGEGEEAFHRHHQLGVCVRDFERDHQKRYGKGKDRISEPFQTGNFAAAPAEVLFRRYELVAGQFANHRNRHRSIIVP